MHGGVDGEGAQRDAEERVPDVRRDEAGGERGEHRGGLGEDARLGPAAEEGDARELEALADDREHQERGPPRHDDGGLEASGPERGTADARDRAEQLHEHRVRGLASPHGQVDGDERGGRGGPGEAGEQPATGYGRPGDLREQEHRAGAARDGRGVPPDVPRAAPGAQGDRPLQPDGDPEEAVDHEHAVHGAERCGRHGRDGAESHERGVEPGEDGGRDEREQGEASAGDRTRGGWGHPSNIEDADTLKS